MDCVGFMRNLSLYLSWIIVMVVQQFYNKCTIQLILSISEDTLAQPPTPIKIKNDHQPWDFKNLFSELSIKMTCCILFLVCMGFYFNLGQQIWAILIFKQYEFIRLCYGLRQINYSYNISVFMSASGLIYSLVSRGHQTILSSFSAYAGNFPSVALDVLHRCNLSKTFGQFATANYNFYTFVKEGLVFLVMVDATYQTRIAVSFLKKVQEIFFKTYDLQRRNSAVAHSLKDFNNVLKENMSLYNDKTKVDKLSQLKKELTELEQISLQNMDRVIQRGEKIEVLVKKSEMMTDQSYDLKDTAKKVKNRMWWKNKKIMIGIILLVLIILGIVIWLIAK